MTQQSLDLAQELNRLFAATEQSLHDQINAHVVRERDLLSLVTSLEEQLAIASKQNKNELGKSGELDQIHSLHASLIRAVDSLASRDLASLEQISALQRELIADSRQRAVRENELLLSLGREREALGSALETLAHRNERISELDEENRILADQLASMRGELEKLQETARAAQSLVAERAAEVVRAHDALNAQQHRILVGEAERLELGERLRSEVTVTNSLRAQVSLAFDQLRTEFSVLRQQLDAQAEFVRHGGTMLTWLLSLPRDDFLREAYRTLLRRSPDPAGLAHYQAHFEGGRPRIRILGEIHNSSEARGRGVFFKEIADAARCESRSRWPICGSFFRAIALAQYPRGIQIDPDFDSSADASELQYSIAIPLWEESDSAFIDKAYRVLLRRSPDATGSAFYRSKLQNGVTRLEILNQISRSSECKENGTKMPRLRMYAVTARSIRGLGFGRSLHSRLKASSLAASLNVRSDNVSGPIFSSIESTLSGGSSAEPPGVPQRVRASVAVSKDMFLEAVKEELLMKATNG